MKNFLFFLFFFFTINTIIGQGTETFTGISGTTGSYLTRSWTGDDGSTWTATNARTSETINGDALTLNDDVANTYLESGTISGGVGDITISTQRKFSGGTGSVDVLINGTSVGTVPYSDVVQTTTISGINILGSFVIRIDNNIGGSNSGGADRVAIDDVTWTAGTTSPTVGFDNATNSENEIDATFSISIPVTLTNYASDVTLNVAVTGGTAEAGDYTLNSSVISFFANGTVDVLMDIHDDVDFDDETIELTITETTSTGVTISTAVHTVTIIDNEEAPLPDVVINEIMYNAITETTGEWIELYNNDASPVTLDCYIITDGDWDISIPSGTTIPANGHLTIGRSTAEKGDGTTFTPDVNLSTCSCASSLSTSTGAISFTNGGEFVALFNDTGVFIDGVIFESPSTSSGSNHPINAGTETVNAQGGCSSITVDIAGNAAFSGSGSSFVALVNNFEDAGTAAGTSGNGVTVGRFPDGSATFQYFPTSPDQTSPGAMNALPIELASFNGKENNDNVDLFWQTSQEINNDYFQIQHSSNGRDFQIIGKVQGAGNSDVLENYEFTHRTPVTGANYYRLQQFDFDGASSFSDIVVVRMDKGNQVAIYPNPVANELTIVMAEETAINTIAEILNQTGNVVASQELTAKTLTETMNTADLPSGIYYLRILNGNEVTITRFVKK